MIYLKKFVETGRINHVELGMSQAMVDELIGSPERASPSTRGIIPVIEWKYGDMYMVFEKTIGRLISILLAGFKADVQGGSIGIDSWIIGNQLRCAVAESELQKDSILYTKSIKKNSQYRVTLLLESGVKMRFVGANDHDATLVEVETTIPED